MPRWLCSLLAVAGVSLASPALGADPSPSGYEIGVGTGYAFEAGDKSSSLTAPRGTDSPNPMGNFVSGQWPIWVDAGYRLSPSLYLGGYFQYGFGSVNYDFQSSCYEANIDCSASDVRVGITARYHFAPAWPLSPWAGYGFGYEWGSFLFHQSVLVPSSTDLLRWSGFEIMNLQLGADYALPYGMVMSPFLSFSLGEFRKVSITDTQGSGAPTTSEQSLTGYLLHEWILLGVRFALRP